jgi:Putative transposase
MGPDPSTQSSSRCRLTVRAHPCEDTTRYGARPPFSLERISILANGRIAYRLKKPRRNGATHLVLTPVHFLARIAALVPPPRYPLLRFSGVLAPRSSWRAAVVPRGIKEQTAESPSEMTKKKKKPSKAPLVRSAATPSTARAGRTSLSDGVVRPVYARIDWATLLRRVYLEDVLACPCGGRRMLIADIHDRESVVAILTHLGLPTEAPPVARARSPSVQHA